MRSLTVIEQTFLARGERSLARIATVDEHGLPHVVPGGWHWDADAEELVLTGRNVGRTARAAHVRRTGVAAISIDGIAEGPGWSPWAFLAPGPAHVDETEDTIRLRPTWVRSWGLDPPNKTRPDAQDDHQTGDPSARPTQ